MFWSGEITLGEKIFFVVFNTLAALFVIVGGIVGILYCVVMDNWFSAIALIILIPLLTAWIFWATINILIYINKDENEEQDPE